jgi:hypothetical protein
MRTAGSFSVLLLLTCVRAPYLRSQSRPAPLNFEEAQALVGTYCGTCHKGPSPPGDLDLTKFTTPQGVLAEPQTWEKVSLRVRMGEMPPKGLPTPREPERGRFLLWIESNLRAASCPSGTPPGPYSVRRLNRNEYSSTIRDLLNIQINAGHDLPIDGAGGEGFDNSAGTLTLSPLHAEKYLEAASEALHYAFKEPRSREILLIAQPNQTTSPQQAAREILAAFLPRAFRRPVTPAEIESSLALFKKAQAHSDTFEDAILLTLEGALISPNFLFLLQEPNPHPEARALTDFELASRLSYFLWGSMPDQALFKLAAQGALHDPAVLRRQVVRLLRESAVEKGADTADIESPRRVHDFVERFVEQWLGTRELGTAIKPDPKLFPQFYNPDLQSNIREEPALFFEQLVTKNLSLLNLLDSDWILLNDDLKGLYNISVPTELRASWKAGHDHRGGLLGMAAVLAVTSYPNRTSPVRRGNWILDTFLGVPVPPPPSNVPALPEARQDQPTTVRERLMAHRQNPVCGSCHNRIDPLGFALANYDVLGRWRTEENGKPIDATGELPDGTVVHGPQELKQALLNRKDLFIRNLTRKMLGYALGRGLTFEDYCTVDDIVLQVERDDYRTQTLIQGIVASVPFRYKPGATKQK